MLVLGWGMITVPIVQCSQSVFRYIYKNIWIYKAHSQKISQLNISNSYCVMEWINSIWTSIWDCEIVNNCYILCCFAAHVPSPIQVGKSLKFRMTSSKCQFAVLFSATMTNREAHGCLCRLSELWQSREKHSICQKLDSAFSLCWTNRNSYG